MNQMGLWLLSHSFVPSNNSPFIAVFIEKETRLIYKFPVYNLTYFWQKDFGEICFGPIRGGSFSFRRSNYVNVFSPRSLLKGTSWKRSLTALFAVLRLSMQL